MACCPAPRLHDLTLYGAYRRELLCMSCGKTISGDVINWLDPSEQERYSRADVHPAIANRDSPN